MDSSDWIAVAGAAIAAVLALAGISSTWAMTWYHAKQRSEEREAQWERDDQLAKQAMAREDELEVRSLRREEITKFTEPMREVMILSSDLFHAAAEAITGATTEEAFHVESNKFHELASSLASATPATLRVEVAKLMIELIDVHRNLSKAVKSGQSSQIVGIGREGVSIRYKLQGVLSDARVNIS